MAIINVESLVACKGKPTAWFFPTTPSEASLGVSICHTCPVERECRQDAHERHEPVGTWGGETEWERNRSHVTNLDRCLTCDTDDLVVPERKGVFRTRCLGCGQRW